MFIPNQARTQYLLSRLLCVPPDDFLKFSDGPNTPRHLPQDFKLATAITPLTIWQQWHHGLTFSGGIAVGPLKKIVQVHQKQQGVIVRF